MARTALTPQQMTGPFVATVPTLTFAAADPSNGNLFAMSKGDILLIYNSGGSSYTFTLTSVADQHARTGDIAAQSITAGAFAVYGPLDFPGWQQTDGNFYLTASNASVKFAIIRA